jgi:hypothetical protein
VEEGTDEKLREGNLEKIKLKTLISGRKDIMKNGINISTFSLKNRS